MKRPHSTAKVPRVVRVKSGSAKMRRSGVMDLRVAFTGGRRDLMVRLATIRRTRLISARTRVDQAKPMRGKRACRVSG